MTTEYTVIIVNTAVSTATNMYNKCHRNLDRRINSKNLRIPNIGSAKLVKI